MTDQPPRRFPPPWRIVEFPDRYCVEDANGQRLGTFYSARSTGTLTLDEAHRMAVNFARLPELLRRKTDDGQMS
jgi:hypothetical protein